MFLSNKHIHIEQNILSSYRSCIELISATTWNNAIKCQTDRFTDKWASIPAGSKLIHTFSTGIYHKDLLVVCLCTTCISSYTSGFYTDVSDMIHLVLQGLYLMLNIIIEMHGGWFSCMLCLLCKWPSKGVFTDASPWVIPHANN